MSNPLNSILTIAGVTALLAVAAYSEKIVQKPDRKDGRVVITYWEKWTNFEADAMRAVVDEFNKSQDKIYVEYLSVSGVAQKTLMAVSGGIPPDVAGLFGPNTPQYAFNNAVMPLDELCAENGISRDQYIPVYYDMCTYKGKLWALPTMPASTGLHYNMALFEEAGVDPNKPPQTIEELDAIDQKMSKLGSNGKILRAGYLPTEPNWWPWSWPGVFGGKLWDGKGKITMTDPNTIRAYEWVASYSKRYGPGNMQSFQQGFGGFDSAQNAFMDNKVASVNQGVWMYNFVTKYRPDFKLNIVPFPHPADRPDLANSTVIDLDILVIPRGAKHPKEAFEFIKFVQSNKGMELLAVGQKKHTPLIKVTPGFYENHPNPFVKLFADQAKSKNALSPPKTPIWPEWQAELSAAFQEVNLGTMSAKDAMKKVQDKMQPILDDTAAIERKRGLVDPQEEVNP